MIVLKHLAKEFNADPKHLRKLLRLKFPIPQGRRWAWKPDSPTLKKIKIYLSNELHKRASK